MLADTSPAQTTPPSFLSLAGHPVRWRLLNDLAHSDRRVAELCARLQLPQSLVSYHLGRLRAEGVVSRRRSTADGRDSYYVLELDRCGELLSGAGGALHPALRLAPPGPDRPTPCARHRSAWVLFLCTGNSARSQIAEALTEQLGGGVVQARSAGSHPKSLHLGAVRSLHERGIDIAGRRSKHLSEFSGQRFDYVVSLCDRVREVCPEFPGQPGRSGQIHWSIPDPSASGPDDQATLTAFRHVAAELDTRIGYLLAGIGARPDRAA